MLKVSLNLWAKLKPIISINPVDIKIIKRFLLRDRHIEISVKTIISINELRNVLYLIFSPAYIFTTKMIDNDKKMISDDNIAG
jgi:hypothetical protein